jgi:hypothetical protein
MSTALAERGGVDAAVVERVLLHGDLRQLTPAQKVSYYKAVCESVGLNPLTQPFQYLTLNGKEVLYARRDATEQLRQIHQVSVQITAREVMEDCYVVTARATLPSGRQDENIGAVPIGGLKGEARANAMMKAETKAKRRVTLAICGLGMLDETEVETIAPPPAPATVVDVSTGEDVPLAAKPAAPAGYHYLAGYTIRNGWHEASLLQWDAQGGALKISTKLPHVGQLVEKAAREGVPVKADVTMKKNTVGEAYVNKLLLWSLPIAEAAIDAEIAAKDAGEQPF